MRGKWALAAAAVLALVVVGGVGGLTMRAFAGTAHMKVVTKTVTKLCVYVDKTDGGDSYGDLSVVPKYNHKICIAGKQGPAGDSSVITWNKTVQDVTSPPTAKRKAGGGLPVGATDLATVGPFTVIGVCTGSDGVANAVTDIVSAQNGSSMTWGSTTYNLGNFASGDFNQASVPASSNDPADPVFAGEGSAGEFSVSTGDGTTAFTGSANNGAYLTGTEGGPACSFSGYLVMEK